jgi:hypothetical protein
MPKRFSPRDSSFPKKVSGFIYNDNTKSVLINANTSISKVKYEQMLTVILKLMYKPTDTLHISF